MYRVRRDSSGYRQNPGPVAFNQGAHLTLECIVDGCLRFALDLPQVSLAAETLRIDLVDIFGARRPRGKPSALGDDLDAAERLTVSRCGGERRSDRLAGQ